MDHNCKKSNDSQPSGFQLQPDGITRCASCGERPTHDEKIHQSENTSHNSKNRRNR